MHEFQDVATWIGGLGSGPEQTLMQRALGAVEKDSAIGAYCGPGGAINRRMNKRPVSTFKRGVANDRFVGDCCHHVDPNRVSGFLFWLSEADRAQSPRTLLPYQPVKPKLPVSGSPVRLFGTVPAIRHFFEHALLAHPCQILTWDTDIRELLGAHFVFSLSKR